ncbi:MAG: GIY-YIG nuclease family protein [Xanthobacteraceae bacterium]
MAKIAAACRYYGRIPAYGELRMYKKVDPDFPSHGAISTFGGKAMLVRRLGEWMRSNPGYDDVAAMLPQEAGHAEPRANVLEGYVYLIRSGPHYKIGRGDQLERRVKQIRVALPEAASLVHAIRTDDPPGIEAYWHRRFAERRANGEWFKLTSADVVAFKRRKYQ